MTAAALGHNLPPTPTPTQRQIDRFKELRAKATEWHKLGSLPDDETANLCKAFKEQVRLLRNEIEAQRESEKAPHLEAGRAVDREFKPYLESLDGQIKAMLALEDNYLKRKKEEQRKAAEAAEAEARRAAEAAARIAEQAKDASDFAAQDAVREAAAVADEAQKQAEKIASTRVAIGADVIAGGRRKATTLRKFTVLSVNDPQKLLKHLIRSRVDMAEINDALVRAARKLRAEDEDVVIPGLTVTVEERAQ